MSANERKLKWCKHGHIVGEVKKVTFGTRRVKALMLYEQSVELEDVPEELPPLRARLIGSAADVTCTICKATLEWIIGQDTFDALMAHYPPVKHV
jgi:hypothetical protein